MAPKHEKRTIFMKIMAIFGKGVSEMFWLFIPGIISKERKNNDHNYH